VNKEPFEANHDADSAEMGAGTALIQQDATIFGMMECWRPPEW